MRPVAPFGSTSSKPHYDPALIHRCLPDELLFEVGASFLFSRYTSFSHCTEILKLIS